MRETKKLKEANEGTLRGIKIQEESAVSKYVYA
jgi:hypothetical protein